MCHLTPPPGLAAVPMGLEPLFLQPCKWEKQSPSLTPSREPNGMVESPRQQGRLPPPWTQAGGRGPSTAGVAQVGVLER